MDGLRCIGDGQYHRFGSFVCYSNIQSQGQSSTTFHTLEPIPFANEFVSNAGQPSEPIIRQLSLLNPSEFISAKHPTIAYKPFQFQRQALHRHLQTLPIIWVPMFTARYYSTDLSISDLISVYSSSISRPRISPKTCPVPAGQLTSYDENHCKTTELPHHYHLPHASYIIIMDMCRPWVNESLQKINDTGVTMKKYMLSSTITVSPWWYMGSWFLRSVRCSRRALSTIILSGGGTWYSCAGDIYIYIFDMISDATRRLELIHMCVHTMRCSFWKIFGICVSQSCRIIEKTAS